MMMDNPPLSMLLKDTFSSFANIKIAFDNNAKNFVQLIATFFPFVIAFIYLLNKKSSLRTI